MQACMNEAADLVALVAKLKLDHAKELEERDMKHAADMSKLTDRLAEKCPLSSPPPQSLRLKLRLRMP